MHGPSTVAHLLFLLRRRMAGYSFAAQSKWFDNSRMHYVSYGGEGVEPLTLFKKRKLLILRLGKNHKTRDSTRPRYTSGTRRMSSDSTNPSAYFPKSFMLLAQNCRASSDNRISSLPCVQNCHAALRAYSQTSNVFAVACGSINSRGGTCPSPVGAYSIETWSNAGARRKRELSAKNSMLY